MAKSEGRFVFRDSTILVNVEDVTTTMSKEAIKSMADLLPDSFFQSIIKTFNDSLLEQGEPSMTEPEFNFIKEHVFRITGTKRIEDREQWH